MKFILSGEYGELRPTGTHHGIDIAMPKNTELKAFEDAIVTQVFDGSNPIGKGVKIQLENGQDAIYGHLEKVNVKVGEILQKGETIGYSGNTGRVTGENGGYHLHFALKENDKFVDPSHLYNTIVSMSEGPKGIGQWAWDKYGEVANYVVGKEVEFIFKPFANALRDLVYMIVDGLTAIMPEIGFITVLLTGVVIMITGRAVKPLVWGSSILTVVIAWLAIAHS